MGSAPEPADSFEWKLRLLLHSIVDGRVEACRGARELHRLGSMVDDRPEVASEPNHLANRAIQFMMLVEECQSTIPSARDGSRREIISRARRLLRSMG
jgi:hypothetical protein